MSRVVWVKNTLVLVVFLASAVFLATSVSLWQMNLSETTVMYSHPGLVGWWRFDEGDGNTVGDGSRLGNEGRVYGAAWIDGKYGKALSFAGEGQHVNIKEYSDFEALKYKGGNMTVECWVKVSAAETMGGVIISKPWNRMGHYNYWIQWTSENKISILVGGDDHAVSFQTAKNFTKEQYHYIVGVFDSAKNVLLYVDGSLEASDTHDITVWTPSPEHYGDGDDPLVIAHIYPYICILERSPAHTLIGIVDEVRIYNRALSATEIQQIYDGFYGN